jgi:hypothetical protein
LGRCRAVSQRWQKVTDKAELQPRIFEHEDSLMDLKSVYIHTCALGVSPRANSL